jgi:hypothetical protein
MGLMVLWIWCEIILAKVWDHIVFSFFFVESFVINFTIVKIPSAVISKKGTIAQNGYVA